MYGIVLRARHDPIAGETVLKLTTAPIGWRVSDNLMLADTRQLGLSNRNVSTLWDHNETVRIKSVSGDTVTLETPLKFDQIVLLVSIMIV